MKMYCPACGEEGVIEDFTLQPGELEIVCHGCGTVWIVFIQFSEKEASE